MYLLKLGLNMKQQRCAKIAVIGECMLEMSAAHDSYYKLAFAGDTYNVAVYLKRALRLSNVVVEYVTALGHDVYSQQMVHAWQEEGIGSSLVRHLTGKLPGLYTIETDQHGERSFYYYRSSAAVRDLFLGEGGMQLAQQLLEYDYLFLSGITLAVMHPEGRELLIDTIKKAYKKGCMICFDSNYRSSLWSSVNTARTVISELLPYVHLGLPSFNDANALFGDETPEKTYQRWHDGGVGQVIVKMGEAGYGIGDKDGYRHIPVSPVKQVDTTAAGDAFDGALLAAIMNGDDLSSAAAFAAKVAAVVVAHKGAIVDAGLFE
jgi:2-dehydro-3-deoxygluconokinase